MGQDTVQLVQAVIADFQLSLAATALMDGDTRTERVGQVGLETLDVCILDSLGRFWRCWPLQRFDQAFCGTHRQAATDYLASVSYTHLTLPTIYSV